MIATRTRFGPADHGVPVTRDSVKGAEFQLGFEYEPIHGRLYVSPKPCLAEAYIFDWFDGKLHGHSREHPDQIRQTLGHGAVCVPDGGSWTSPSPDILAYREYPVNRSLRDMRWEDVSPILVADAIVDTPSERVFERNLELFVRVPSILEYWILDGSENADRPTLVVHIRSGRDWLVTRYGYGEMFATELLPGFALLIDPRS